MSTYEPGTVAVATVRGRAGVRVMRSAGDDGWGWVTADKIESWRVHEDRLVHDVRPLVVLDLAQCPSTHWVRALRGLLPDDVEAWDDGQVFVNAIADQIEAQTKPPRIPEPGVGSIVNAALAGSSDPRPHPRVRLRQGWTRLDADGSAINMFEWSDLVDPALIREGLS